MIRVIYRDGTEDLVTQKFLDILLYLGEVQMFRRNDDWAVVGVDPIRIPSQGSYIGRERRMHRSTSFQAMAMTG